MLTPHRLGRAFAPPAPLPSFEALESDLAALRGASDRKTGTILTATPGRAKHLLYSSEAAPNLDVKSLEARADGVAASKGRMADVGLCRCAPARGRAFSLRGQPDSTPQNDISRVVVRSCVFDWTACMWVRAQVLVMDEADRILDLGFSEDLCAGWRWYRVMRRLAEDLAMGGAGDCLGLAPALFVVVVPQSEGARPRCTPRPCLRKLPCVDPLPRIAQLRRGLVSSPSCRNNGEQARKLWPHGTSEFSATVQYWLAFYVRQVEFPGSACRFTQRRAALDTPTIRRKAALC